MTGVFCRFRPVPHALVVAGCLAMIMAGGCARTLERFGLAGDDAAPAEPVQEAGTVPDITGAPPEVAAAYREAAAKEVPPRTFFEARRQARRAADTAADALNAEGYFDGRADGEARDDPPAAAVIVAPGPRFSIGAIRLDLSGEVAPDVRKQAEAAMGLASGDIARPGAIYAAHEASVLSLRAAGHADAEAAGVDAVGDREAATLDVTLSIAPGPRVRLGDLVVAGESPLRDSYLQSLKTWQTGDYFSPGALSDFRARLAELRIFSASGAELADTGAETRDVVATLQASKPRTLALGASVSTSEGAGFDAVWERRNFTRRADTLRVFSRLATLERSLGATWTQPNARRYGRTFVLGAEAANEETDEFERNGLDLRIDITQPFADDIRLALGGVLSYAQETDAFGDRDTLTLAGLARASLDRANDLLDPTEGYRAEAALRPAVALGGDGAPFVSASVSGSAYRAMDEADRLVLAARARLGAVFGADAADIPVSYRFFAGGGGSVRGFEYQSLSPEIIAPRTGFRERIGGRSVAEASLEARYRMSERFGLVGFFDAGAAGEETTPDFAELGYGAGVGVRYYGGFGPIRADLAVPVSDRDGQPAFQVYLSIGQAF